MRERVEGFGGTFALWSAPGEGTEIDVRVPMERSEERVHE
jgi:signal transduction histidine kinase